MNALRSPSCAALLRRTNSAKARPCASLASVPGPLLRAAGETRATQPTRGEVKAPGQALLILGLHHLTAGIALRAEGLRDLFTRQDGVVVAAIEDHPAVGAGLPEVDLLLEGEMFR